MRKRYKLADAKYGDHYASPIAKKETASSNELMRYSNKNNTIPVDLSKLDH